MRVVIDTNVVVSAAFKDKDFSEAKKILSSTILSVSQFKKLVCDRL